MQSARMNNQLVAKMPARVGLLADVTDAVKSAGVNITALSAYERDGQGKFLLVTDDNAKATAALARLNAEVKEKSVIEVDLTNEVGALQAVSRKLAEAGINIDYVYATTCGVTCSCDTTTAVIKTDDDAKAVGLLNG